MSEDMKQYSGTAVHRVFDKLVEIICEQDEEIQILKKQTNDACQRELNSRMRQINRILELANMCDSVDSDDIFAIFGGRDVH